MLNKVLYLRLHCRPTGVTESKMSGRRDVVNTILLMVLILVSLLYLQASLSKPSGSSLDSRNKSGPEAIHIKDKADVISFRRDLPLVWIGGPPRSGNSLMQQILDTHPDVRCGEDTRLIPRYLDLHEQMTNAAVTGLRRLEQVNVTMEMTQEALAAYIVSIIAQQGELAPRLCNKDPSSFRHLTTLAKIFPQSKFLFLVRDGRAVCHSLISKRIWAEGFNNSDYVSCLENWSSRMLAMESQCSRVGGKLCLRIFYEQLVQQPEAILKTVTQFLGIQWSDRLLEHDKHSRPPTDQTDG